MVNLEHVADILRDHGWSVMADELAAAAPGLRDAVHDAVAYRLGECAGLDDPDLDPDDAALIERYDAVAAVMGW